MKISVITTVKNEEEGIGSFLESLIDQSKRPDEIIISDGGSTDRTQQIVEDFIKKYPEAGVEFIEAPGNISYGRNRAIEKAQNEIIAATDAGCRIDRYWLSNITTPFEKDAAIDVVAGWYEPDAKSELELYIAAFSHPYISEIDPDKFLPSGRSVAFRKKIWKKIGGYPEKMPYTGEDTLFDLEAKKAGAKFYFAKKAKVYWQPRRTFKDFLKQWFLYGKGDGQARILYRMYLMILARYLLFGAFIYLAIAYNVLFFLGALVESALYFYKIRAKFYRPHSLAKFLIIPIFLFFKDWSQIFGFIYGLVTKPVDSTHFKKTIVVLSPVTWDSPIHQRAHHIASELSREAEVVFVNPPMPIIFLAKLKNWSRLAERFQSPRHVQKNLKVFPSAIILPFYYFSPFFNKINNWLLARYLRKNLNRLKYKIDILLAMEPHFYPVISKMGERISIYDCADEWSEFSTPGPRFVQNRHKKNIVWMEREILNKVKIVQATTRDLRNKCQAINPRSYLIENAAETEHFSQALDPKVKVPTKLAKLQHPIIGYVGTIKYWLDLAAVEYLAKKRPKWNIVMIGPADIDLSRYKKYKNIYFLGSVDYQNLPSYIKAFDICIIPFKRSELTQNVNPVKLYEYLAAGKPVVGSFFAVKPEFKNLVRLAENHREFLDQIEAGLEEKESKVSERLQFAEKNSWRSRSAEIKKIIANE